MFSECHTFGQLQPLHEGEVRISFHYHPVIISNRGFICDICLNRFEAGTPHYFCAQCDFDLCPDCNAFASNSPLLQIKHELLSQYLNYQEAQEMINFLYSQEQIHYESPVLAHIISNSRPIFYLCDEQKKDPNHEHFKLIGTREYTY